MRYRNFAIIIYILSISIPISIIQLYLINDQLLAHLLIPAVIITIIYVIAFVYGLIQKKKIFILSLPIYILTFILFFKAVQFQDKNSLRTADEIIILIEKYKVDHNHYPGSLKQLNGKYISSVPKNWRGLIPYDYLYFYDTTNHSFSLNQKFGKHGGRVWQSSMGSWDYYGD
ncbi:hypothetical protein [Pedobacter frigiditerrae]|uniref:hypothetical protein n=1 Tax=Pedobacter frigiditerrae TaxID=2530452 RepID=UPI0029302B8B|nr:hypothetical protein [Pedobacter frigiditerrae]